MLAKKPFLNKFYKYSDTIVKIKKISKKYNKIYTEDINTGEKIIIPYEQYDLILHRIYTIGEVAKIVERRTDTIRKYEKKGLIPKSKKFGEKYKSYQNWRYFEESEVYDMVEFFNTRVPGRPMKKATVDNQIKTIQEKVKLKF